MEQLELKEILKKIKVDGELNYLNDLIQNIQIKNLIKNIVKKYKYNHKDIKYLCETMIKEITIKYYKYEKSEYIVDQYLHYLRKSLGRRVRRELEQDRPKEEIMYGLSNDFDNFGENVDFTDFIIENIALYEALKELEPDESYVIEKIYFEGFTEENIAKNFNMTQQNINKIKNRGLIKLKKLLS